MEGEIQHHFSKEKIATTGARILSDLWNNTFQALIDNAGAEKALELIKPYMKHHGFAAGHIWRERLKVSSDGWSFLIIWKILTDIFGVTHSAVARTQNGYSFDVSSCPFSNFSWAHCEAWCSITAKEMVRTHFPECSLTFDQMLTKGDGRCRGVVTDTSAKSPPCEIALSDLDNPTISTEEKEYFRVAILAQVWIYATNALVDFAGPEKAVELMRNYMKQSGMSEGLDFHKKLGIKGRDATSIALIIRFSNACLQQKGKVIKSEADWMEKEITECPFSNASQDICANLLSIRSNGICEAINPEYEFVSEKRMCKGDKSCHWVIKKKNPS